MQTETKKFNNNKYTKLENKIRFITATSLFDGHDVSINIIRRMLQHLGTEVIHLGHNRSAEEVAHAAIAEDVQGIAISSYQGGHIEYLSYLLILLKKSKAEHIKIFAGGGGVISQEEIKILHKLGISKVFSPEDGLKLGIKGMATFILKECDFSTIPLNKIFPKQLSTTKHFPIAQTITILELNNKNFTNYIQNFRTYCNNISKKSALSPIIGVTGTGGSGKSSLIDEILLRFLSNFPEKTAAILSIDPSNKKTGGALLGDRIRLNSASNKRLFIRSMATRKSNSSISNSIKDATICLQAAGFDLILIETVGIGQNDSKITELCNISIYVMTPEYGAESQLEKIEMLNFRYCIF